jgi:hypothetical protein
MMDLKMTRNKSSTCGRISSVVPVVVVVGVMAVFENLFLATVFMKSEVSDEIRKIINSGNSHIY